MNINSFVFLFIGSAFGLILRIFIENNFKIKIGFSLNNTSLVNLLASLLLGVLLAFNQTNKDLLLLFYIGFLGCFSTFSSFIYQLFYLLQTRQFVRLFLHYFEVIILSILFFYLGYYLVKIFQVSYLI